MPYIAVRPCEFGGTKYFVNDLIPDGVITNPKKHIESKVIAPQKGTETKAEITTDNFMFPILTNDGIVTQEVSAENLLEALIIVQKNANEAIKDINKCDNQDILVMVYSLDSRKGVKDTIDKRTAALEGDE